MVNRSDLGLCRAVQGFPITPMFSRAWEFRKTLHDPTQLRIRVPNQCAVSNGEIYESEGS